MMYCTGGIRCERFSALLSQIKRESPSLQTKGEFMVQGGIERYLKTFPEGGYWKGRNFLFDKRQEQVPAKKPEEELEREVESCCCACKRRWGQYRGGYKCCVQECQVPIIVCPDCRAVDPASLRCPLCEEGHSVRELQAPRLLGAKRCKTDAMAVDARAAKRAKHMDKEPSTRLFVGGLPLVVDATAIRGRLQQGVVMVDWITDKKTGLWYGSAFVQMASREEADRVVRVAHGQDGLRMGKRRLRVNYAPLAQGSEWPPAGHRELERPPVPVNPCR
mmetsp:Transcript_32700/g.76021  ORF Transcript_32700/g.76021 Transcript_32700/m.76021 type:complete len:276 (+) Transcript_32700:177-1004(+)